MNNKYEKISTQQFEEKERYKIYSQLCHEVFAKKRLAESHENFGSTEEAQIDFKEAIDLREQALEYASPEISKWGDSEKRSELTNLGSLYAEVGEIQEAREKLLEVINGFGKITEDPSRIEEAAEIGFFEAVKKDDKGEVIERAINGEEAIDALQQARELNQKINNIGESKHSAEDKKTWDKIYVSGMLTILFGYNQERFNQLSEKQKNRLDWKGMGEVEFTKEHLELAKKLLQTHEGQKFYGGPLGPQNQKLIRIEKRLKSKS